FIQCKESVDANSELFKEADDAALDKNTYEIRFCELISASLKAGGFSGLAGLWPEGCGIALQAMNINAA
ncbi:MAG: hypothetical protein UDQ48_03300, partial [Dialister sp.]|uniref:hypothetical protein n=1 Tax=Dialister sp. TaxID=1955814 RepID=UPI002E787161